MLFLHPERTDGPGSVPGGHFFINSSPDDASTIVAANNGQALRVDTGSSILTNKLASSVTNEINSGSVLLDAGAYIEVDVKLTARNELGEGIPDGANAARALVAIQLRTFR